MQLVVLAAGMGSRFGGFKQIEPIDEYNNFIIDYSLYDAIEAGINKVVFIIKENMYEVFSKTIGNRLPKDIEIKYVFQNIDDIPNNIDIKIDRSKPWGTAHALYAARNVITDDFVIINSDDYYGKESYKIAHKYLSSLNCGEKGKYANVAFKVENTLTVNGAVKRGVCFYNESNYLTDLVESNIEKKENTLIATPINQEKNKMILEPNTLVSMNMFVFTKDILEYLEERFINFLNDKETDLYKDEFLLPEVVSCLINENRVSVKVLRSPSVWYGVTYAQDKELFVNSMRTLVEKGKYKKGLW